jgi:hypothetical protein
VDENEDGDHTACQANPDSGQQCESRTASRPRQRSTCNGAKQQGGSTQEHDEQKTGGNHASEYG